MKESIFATYINKSIIVCKALASKKGVVISAPVLIAMPVFSEIQQAIWLLFWLMVVDFITGVLASRHEKKHAEILKPELKSETLISSEKLKKSGFKVLLYTCSILVVYRAENIFKLKSFSWSFSDLELSATLVLVFFWCVVEFYSIVFENFKRMGLDVVLKISEVFSTFKKIKKEVKS